VAADSPEGLLATARAELAANKGETALAALERLLVLLPGGSDELYWLLGQALEFNGPKRDVKAAFAAYSKLLDFWPRSTWYRQAKDRAAYIERYYLEIR
jgi:outer membrane protein assembly factor BamD (BamD/ComL family)